MAQAMFVLVVMTTPAAASPFVFHEVLFADWLGKKLVTAMFNNTWSSLRVSLKAVLGENTNIIYVKFFFFLDTYILNQMCGKVASILIFFKIFKSSQRRQYRFNWRGFSLKSNKLEYSPSVGPNLNSSVMNDVEALLIQQL